MYCLTTMIVINSKLVVMTMILTTLKGLTIVSLCMNTPATSLFLTQLHLYIEKSFISEVTEE